MVKHVVLWKLAESAEGHSKWENAKIIKEGLENLKGVIPCLKSVQVGLNENGGDFDLVLLTEFDSMEDLKAYDTHPEHEKVRAYVRKVIEQRASVDFTC